MRLCIGMLGEGITARKAFCKLAKINVSFFPFSLVLMTIALVCETASEIVVHYKNSRCTNSSRVQWKKMEMQISGRLEKRAPKILTIFCNSLFYLVLR